MKPPRVDVLKPSMVCPLCGARNVRFIRITTGVPGTQPVESIDCRCVAPGPKGY